eukprot:scaffold243308_cov20-Prasinocladus_malaysianus.AAC.2
MLLTTAARGGVVGDDLADQAGAVGALMLLLPAAKNALHHSMVYAFISREVITGREFIYRSVRALMNDRHSYV